MKLLIITQKYDFNDSNLGVFIDWWDRLAQKMEQIYILALEKRSEPRMPNMRVLSMGKELGAGFFGKFFGFYSGLFKLISSSDSVLVHMVPKYVILTAPIALLYRKPIYFWYTGVSAHWQLRLAVIFCKKIFTAHEAAMRIDTPKRIITGHGIDIEKFKIEDLKFKINNAITILSVGRITPSKGHYLVIEATAGLIGLGYNLKLKIIGSVIQEYHKKYADNLKEKIHKLGIDKRVEFTGTVKYQEIPKYFNEAEILINAVPFGGLDKVVLEAMASGVIPLTSNNAFSNIFPKNFFKELIFEPGDLEDLKLKLENILSRKLYQNESLFQELRKIVMRDHNLDNLIIRILKEMQ